jgi:hypothetical protein
MSEPTADTLTIISDEVNRQIAENATPEIVRQLTDLMGAYATQADLEQLVGRIQETVQQTVETTFNKKMNEFRREQDERLTLERETTNKQLTGYVQSENFGQLRDIVRDNIQETASVKAAHEVRIAAVETGLKELRQAQQDTVASVGRIALATETIQQSVVVIQRTHLEMIERDRKRQEDVDRELTTLKNNDAANFKNIRQLQTDTVRQDRDINDQRTRIIEWVTPINLLIYGDKEAKIPGLHERMTGIENAIKAALWFLSTPAGRRVSGAVVAALVSSNLISLAASLASR